MKYFKPELLARYRSPDDEVADAAAEEWEQAIAEYRARIRAIRLRLPSHARRLLARVSLHDAKILTLAFGRKQPTFTLQIQLEDTPSQPGRVLELSYLSVAGPHGGVTFRKHPGFNRGSQNQEGILYDEFDLDEQRTFFTHSLLLSGGYEIGVRFHSLRVRRLGEVLVSPHKLPEEEKTWPLVEA
jgi:hypothetical protein